MQNNKETSRGSAGQERVTGGLVAATMTKSVTFTSAGKFGYFFSRIVNLGTYTSKFPSRGVEPI